jgi:GntR family transcriptional regulator
MPFAVKPTPLPPLASSKAEVIVTFFSAIESFEPRHGPLYMQLERILRDAICEGEYAGDAALPTERALAEKYGVSRLTVRKALSELEGEGLLVRRRGAGTFIASRPTPPTGTFSFTENIMKNGEAPHSVWLSKETAVVTADESMLLGLAPEARVHRLKRVRYTLDTAIGIETTLVPKYLGKGELDVGESLEDGLKACGMTPVRALQRLRAVTLAASEADILGIPAGAPGLFIERRSFLDDGRTAELTKAWYRGDMSDLMAEITLS